MSTQRHRRVVRIGLTALALVAASGVVGAHHGAAAYDLAASRTLEATVTVFKWTNPHALIEFDVRDEHGAPQHWTAETAGLTILVRAGWAKSSMKPGDPVTITGHPARNGTPTMILDHIALPGGRTLNNFVPRDLSGVWMQQAPAATFTRAPPPMTAWAAERFARNKPTVGPAAVLDANDPTVECVPAGVPYVLVIPVPFEIVQSADRLTQLFEYNHTVRRIYMDGRHHPDDLNETGGYQWQGHSIGRWDGDTLVVDTVGFNDQTWLDRLGHPHSDELRVVERIQRSAPDTLTYGITVIDPRAYTEPWSGELTFTARRDWDILEHNCQLPGLDYAAYKKKAWDATP